MTEIDAETLFLVVLAQHGIQPDVLKLLAHGGALRAAIRATTCPEPTDALVERERDALAQAIKPFLYLKDPEIEGDPLEGLPDGHGFNVVWDFDSEDGACQFTAGQIRRARAAIRAMRSEK